FGGPQGLLPASGVIERPGAGGGGSGHPPRSHRGDWHFRGVRRRRQEGLGGDWFGPSPAWQTSDGDDRVDAPSSARHRRRRVRALTRLVAAGAVVRVVSPGSRAVVASVAAGGAGLFIIGAATSIAAGTIGYAIAVSVAG